MTQREEFEKWLNTSTKDNSVKHLELMKERRKALSVTIDMLDKIYETQTAEIRTVGLCTNIVNALGD